MSILETEESKMSKQEVLSEINKNAASELYDQAENAIQVLGDFNKAIGILKMAISRVAGDQKSEDFYRSKLKEVRKAEEAAVLIQDAEFLIKEDRFEEAEKKFAEATGISKMNKISEMVREARSKVDHQLYNKLMKTIEFVDEILKKDFQKKKFEKMIDLLDEGLQLAKEEEMIETLEKKKEQVLYQYGTILFEKGDILETENVNFQTLQEHYETNIEIFKQSLTYKKRIDAKKKLKWLILRFEGNKFFNEAVDAEEVGFNSFKAEDYPKAYAFYKKANEAFHKASETFAKGVKLDPSFKESVEYLKEDLEKIPPLLTSLAKLDLKTKLQKTDFLEKVNGKLIEEDF